MNASRNTSYCIDTCSILQRGRTYPPDVFPDLWEKIDDLIKCGRLISSGEVLRELSDNSIMDEASDWAKSRRHMFVDVCEDIERCAVPIIRRYGTRLVDYKKNKSDGDPWVIATAIHGRCTVITEEGRAGGPERVKIPDVCIDLGLPHTNLLGLMRAEGWRFRSS